MSNDYQIIPYEFNSNIEVIHQNDNIWASQKQIAELFDVTAPTINEHIKNILDDGELDNSTIRKFRIVADDSKKRQVNHYSLDMIIAVGYRVNSKTATKFRQWATNVLTTHLRRGVTVNPTLADQNPDLVTDNFYEQISPSMKRRFNKHGHTQAYQIERQQSVEERRRLSGQIIRTTDGNPNFGAIMGYFHISLTGKTKAELIASYEHAVKQTTAIDTLGSVVVRHMNILMESVRMVLESYPDNVIPTRQHVAEIKHIVNQFSEHSRAQLELLSQKTGVPIEKLGDNSHKKRLL